MSNTDELLKKWIGLKLDEQSLSEKSAGRTAEALREQGKLIEESVLSNEYLEQLKTIKTYPSLFSRAEIKPDINTIDKPIYFKEKEND